MTISNPVEATDDSAPSQWCAVYDARTGKVVHLHEFVPADARGRCANDALAQEALRIAAHEHPDADLKVAHPSPSARLDPRAHYRYDAKSRKLVAGPARLTPRERVDRRGNDT